MLATVSPIDLNYAETMGTLSYVERAKLIVTHAAVNETSSNPAIVLQLQRQVLVLQQELVETGKKHQMDVEAIQLREEDVHTELSKKLTADKEETLHAAVDEQKRLNDLVEQKQEVVILFCLDQSSFLTIFCTFRLLKNSRNFQILLYLVAVWVRNE
jgi:hypothetical protein